MAFEERAADLTRYRDGLLSDVLPFWLRHGLDPDHGGYFTSLDQDGSVIDTDKAIWPQGRFAWLLATLYHNFEPRPEWIETARSGIDFLSRHGFDADGRMFFLVTRDGQPLRKRRYVFSESFAALAFAAYAQAAGDGTAADRAGALARQFRRYAFTPGLLEPKVNPDVRPAQALGPHMIMINLGQELRRCIGDPDANAWIDESINAIRRYFMKPELRAVLEMAAPDGGLIDHFDGRTLTPGHAIEAAWFILEEARHRGNDGALRETGLQILEWMWDWGWDREYGGIYYFRDVKGLPVQEYWHDMKFWWAHNETVIATLLAYRLTGDAAWLEKYRLVRDWSYAHFPDPEYGEWFGYLHRDGSVSVRLKGNHWKGPFHLPRMQWYCWRLLEQWDTP